VNRPPSRPRVIVSVTASVDGRVALNRSSVLLHEPAGAVWQALHRPGARRLIQERQAQIERDHHPQAVLEGSGTFVTEHDVPPELPDTDLDRATLLEPSLPERDNCRWFVVVDGRGRVRWTHKGDAHSRLLVLVSRGSPIRYLAYLRREGIPYLVAGDQHVDLALALRLLGSLLGVTCVVSEAGGGLNGALLREGLVDELHVVLIPTLVAGRDTPAMFDGAPLSAGEMPPSLRLVHVRSTADGAVWLHYAVAEGSPAAKRTSPDA
jgi:riboflavin biosynthesis pyrimidine reductase